VCISSGIIIVQLGLGFGGIYGVNRGDALGCIDGRQWDYLKTFGNAFELIHLLVLIAYCILALQVLYKVPKRMGMFSPRTADPTMMTTLAS